MRNFLTQIAYAIQRFMYGRNGVDQLGSFTVVVYLIISILSVLLKINQHIVVRILMTAILIVYLFRILSKNIYARRKENQKFLSIYNPIKSKVNKRINRLKKMKDYLYFKCPQCKAELRVPRGKGNITVTCPKCHATFDKKS